MFSNDEGQTRLNVHVKHFYLQKDVDAAEVVGQSKEVG
jgi:hypothetical protein